MSIANTSPARCGEQSLFPVPEVLLPRGIALRLQTPSDAVMQDALFTQARWDEFSQLPWEEAQKRTFLAQQSALQQHHYRAHYRGAELYTVLQAGEPIGRFYIDRVSPSEIRVIDIAFFEPHRGQGLGTALLQAVLDEAQRTGKFAGLHVESHNPARRLYQRLGFTDAEERPPYIYMTSRAA